MFGSGMAMVVSGGNRKVRIKDKRGNGAWGRVINGGSANTGKGVLECAGEDGSKKVGSGGRRRGRSKRF